MHRFIRRRRLILALLIFPAIMGQAQLTIQNGAVLSTNGNASITLKDIDLIVDGSISQQAGDGVWFFTGSGNNTISGSSSPFFDRLAIAKTGSAKIILSQNISVASGINFNSGLIDLNNSNILLQSGAMLNGENELSRIIGSSGGYIEATAVLNAPGSTNPGNLGALITSSQNLGNTIVRRGHASQTNSGGGGSSILRYYDILPANNTALDATLRIDYFDAELNGLDKSALALWKSTDQLHWTDIGYTARDAAADYVEDSAIPDFSRWTLSTMNNPLPIKLTSFNIGCVNGSAYLSWNTAQEQNTSRFDVERSMDGITWQIIGSVAAAGNSQLGNAYSYTDESSTPGTAFYRIVEMDLDGAVTYSTIASGNCALAGERPVIYPNPVRDILWVSLNSTSTSDLKIEIYNTEGAIIRTQVNHLVQGGNKVDIDVKSLSPGTYILDLTWAGGHQAKVMKFTRLN
jgi:hypothetical protein